MVKRLLGHNASCFVTERAVTRGKRRGKKKKSRRRPPTVHLITVVNLVHPSHTARESRAFHLKAAKQLFFFFHPFPHCRKHSPHKIWQPCGGECNEKKTCRRQEGKKARSKTSDNAYRVPSPLFSICAYVFFSFSFPYPFPSYILMP